MAIIQRQAHFGKQKAKQLTHSHSSKAKKTSLKELENRSKIFARILRNTGCRRGAAVCCVMNNSIDFLISLWGIKYAGCVAWPISPTQPVGRIKSVILDSKAKWLVVDSNAEPLLDTNNLRQGAFNIAWMDSTEKIPEDCFPEFVRDNIDHISMRPVYPEPSKKDPLITFQDLGKTRPKKKTFTQYEIKNIFSSILETVNIDSGSRIGGVLSSNSPSVLLETMSLSHCKALLFLFDSDQPYYGQSFIKEINELRISHLLIESKIIKRFSPEIFSGKTGSSVDNVILWGKGPSEEVLDKLKKGFPTATIYIVSIDQDKNLSIRVDNQSTSRFIQLTNVLRSGTAR